MLHFQDTHATYLLDCCVIIMNTCNQLQPLGASNNKLSAFKVKTANRWGTLQWLQLGCQISVPKTCTGILKHIVHTLTVCWHRLQFVRLICTQSTEASTPNNLKTTCCMHGPQPTSSFPPHPLQMESSLLLTPGVPCHLTLEWCVFLRKAIKVLRVAATTSGTGAASKEVKCCTAERYTRKAQAA